MMPTVSSFSTTRTDIGGLSIPELVARFGTPCYVYDRSIIDQRVAELASFDLIRYAQKACSNIAILDRLRRLGVMVDAVSVGELRRAMAAGYPLHGNPHPIVYTADIFDTESLELIAASGIHCNCGSPDMIDQLGRRSPGSSITLRVNPGFGHGHSRKTNTGGPQSKHGVWFEQIDDCLRRADRYGIIVTGLHMHIGSGTDLEHLSQVCQAMERTAMEVGRTVTTISAGGGLPVPYRSHETYVDLQQYYQLWDQTRQKLSKAFGHLVRLEIEPGRYLVAESGYLVAEIRAIKQMGDNLFYLVDAGFNDLARPILYGAYHPISICPRGATAGGSVLDLNESANGRELADVVVGGPLCESGDIFTQEDGGVVAKRRLPVANVGDYLLLENAGAYGFVMASNYNSKFRTPEVLVEEGTAHLIRKRETFEDLVRNEQIPPI
jgi:diaminopimelate decarboxylase